MKTRNGFVSNSSSSSFIVAVENGFKITDQDPAFQKFKTGHPGRRPLSDAQAAQAIININKILEGLQKGVDYWDEDIGWEIADFIVGLPGVHIIAEIDVTSDAGSVIGVTATKLKDIIAKL